METGRFYQLKTIIPIKIFSVVSSQINYEERHDVIDGRSPIQKFKS